MPYTPTDVCDTTTLSDRIAFTLHHSRGLAASRMLGSSCSKTTIGHTKTPFSRLSHQKQAFRNRAVSILEAGLSWCIGGSKAIAEEPFKLRRWQHDGARQRIIGCSDWPFGYS